MSDNIDWTTLNKDISTSAIADSAVTLDKLQQVASGDSTGLAGSVSFTVPDAKKYCYVLVVSKYENDGSACGMYFIRFGATAILSLANNTGITPTISISSNTITCSGLANYAQWAVHAIMKER